MKTFAIIFAALFAVAIARAVIHDVDYVSGAYGFDDNGSSVHTKIGEIDDKIVGGEEATIEQHPHQISLRTETWFGVTHKCGGSLISQTKALTAAHCVRGEAAAKHYTIMAGSTKRVGDANAQVRTLSRLVKHPQFDTPRLANDIAILFWEEPFTLGANVRPIRLPIANAAVPYGEDSTSSGWGLTDSRGGLAATILQVATLTLVSNEDCARMYPSPYPNVSPDMVCAGGKADQGTCTGDSGGRLVYKNTLIGITSWTRICAHEGYPGVFARVAFFIDWINANIE